MGFGTARQMATAKQPPRCLARPAPARPVPAQWGCGLPGPATAFALRQVARRQPARHAEVAASAAEVASVDMESLEKAAAAAAAVPDDEDTLYVQQPERPRIKKRSRRFKCAQRLRATEFGDLTWSSKLFFLYGPA